MIFIDAATLSMNGANKPVEVYVPLWFANGTNAASTTNTTAGSAALSDGATTFGSATSASPPSQVKLFTLNSSVPSATKFSLECTFLSSGATANVALYDTTNKVAVPGSSITTTSSTMTAVRSQQFTLTPGTSYAVAIWSSNSSYTAQITDASLIIFP